MDQHDNNQHDAPITIAAIGLNLSDPPEPRISIMQLPCPRSLFYNLIPSCTYFSTNQKRN